MKNKVITLAILFILLISFSSSYAQSAQPVADTQYNVQLKEVRITAPWKNDTERYHYNQMRYYVTTILPYLNAATRLFTEVNTKLADPDITRRERKEFISDREDEMRTKFEDKVKSLNVTQGVLLMKLIARQTNVNVYHMIQEFKNPVVAVKWQAWARLNGLNLDRKYHPEEEPYLELIMEDLGYPLPAFYAVNN